MNEPWESIIDREGELVLSSNKAPFTLEDEASVWLVRAGAVDVFFVEAADTKIKTRKSRIKNTDQKSKMSSGTGERKI